MKQVLKQEIKPLLDIEFDADSAFFVEEPWQKLPGEPEESHTILLDIISRTQLKSLRDYYNALVEVELIPYDWGEFQFLNKKFRWADRAWAYHKHNAEIIIAKNEKSLEKFQGAYEGFANLLLEKTKELMDAKTAEECEQFVGLIQAARAKIPDQVTNTYKSLAGDKQNIALSGGIDHSVAAAAVVKFLEDT